MRRTPLLQHQAQLGLNPARTRWSSSVFLGFVFVVSFLFDLRIDGHVARTSIETTDWLVDCNNEYASLHKCVLYTSGLFTKAKINHRIGGTAVQFQVAAKGRLHCMLKCGIWLAGWPMCQPPTPFIWCWINCSSVNPALWNWSLGSFYTRASHAIIHRSPGVMDAARPWCTQARDDVQSRAGRTLPASPTSTCPDCSPLDSQRPLIVANVPTLICAMIDFSYT